MEILKCYPSNFLYLQEYASFLKKSKNASSRGKINIDVPQNRDIFCPNYIWATQNTNKRYETQ